MRRLFGSYKVAIETLVIVAILLVIRAVLWNLGLEGISTSPLTSSIVAGGASRTCARSGSGSSPS